MGEDASRINDLKAFIKLVPELEPIEFLGLTKIFNVEIYEHDGDDIIPRDFDAMYKDLMDNFVYATRKRRKEVLRMLKEINRKKNNF